MYTKLDEVVEKNIILKNRESFIGAGIKSKTLVNCLIGANDSESYIYELKRLKEINKISSKPDIVSDLSIKRWKKEDALWYKIANETSFVAGTLPIYSVSRNNNKIDSNELLDIIAEQMENGVGMITIHPTADEKIFMESKKRIVPITSRGGGIVIKDLMAKKFKEKNVYLEILPEIIKLARKHRVVLSIGATFRSGNIFDSNDRAQLLEINEQIKVANLIADSGVGVIIESPGHARPRDIIKISKILRETGFPIMPLGPIPTDSAIGMDHISAAIGASIMGLEGCANIISAVTREEHTGGLPSIESTIEAIKVAKITAHIIDIHRLNDIDEDKNIVDSRAEIGSCIFGGDSMQCERCNDLCPLSIK